MPVAIYVYLAISLCIGLLLGAPAYHWATIMAFHKRLLERWLVIQALHNQVQALEQTLSNAASQPIELTTIAVRVESAHLTHGALLKRVRRLYWLPFVRKETALRIMAKSILQQADAALLNAESHLRALQSSNSAYCS